MEYERPDPEQLLEKIKREEKKESEQKRGKLKIFVGFAAGVGKTYAMLEAAHIAKDNGVDVVAGYIEPHARPETSAMLDGIETLPFLMVEYKGIQLREFSLDEALKRKPQLLLVDELAHTNAEGLRHQKRYQDIEEILDAGINVYTTVNIQHLESINDMVGNITGIRVKERIPDWVFDHADQVEVVDIEPDDLITRLKEGKIYKKSQAEKALNNFFAKEKLIALREITLRRTADRVNHLILLEQKQKGTREYSTGEHILTCISPSPTCAKVIRTASRLAYAFHGHFTALYVETPVIQEADIKVKKLLEENIKLAKALGAEIATVFGEDIAYQIAEYAKLSNVSKVVLGRTNHKIMFGQTKGSLSEQIAQYAPNLDIYIIPDNQGWSKKGKRKFVREQKKEIVKHHKKDLKDLGKTLIISFIITVIGNWFVYMDFSESNIIMFYFMGVIFTALYTEKRIFSIVSSVLNVLLFNTFFIKPYYSLEFYDKSYSITYLIMFWAAFITSSLVARLRKQSAENAKIAYRTKLLLENSQKLIRADTTQEVIKEIKTRIQKLMNLSVIVYLEQNGKIAGPQLYPRNGVEISEMEEFKASAERAVAGWVIKNGKRAGVCTQTLPSAKAMYLPIRGRGRIFGVVGIVLEERREIPEFEYGLIVAMLNEAALVFEHLSAHDEKKSFQFDN